MGSRIHQYELTKVIAAGGMGTVYLAQDLKHDRLVAIKTIKPDLTTQDVLSFAKTRSASSS